MFSNFGTFGRPGEFGLEMGMWMPGNAELGVGPMMLEALRETTRPHHQAIEQNRLLSELLRPTLTREVYVEVISRFYGFLKPLKDELIRNGSGTVGGALLKDRVKTDLLERDLALMGVGADALRLMPLCTGLPACDRPSRCMGILYVIEGSTLGGQRIAAAVKNSLGIDAGSGCAYFFGYGPSTRSRWEDTCRMLEEYGQGTETERAEAVAAAADTFDKLNRWFQEID